MPQQAPAEPEEEGKKGKGGLIAALVVVLLLVARGIGAYRWFGGGDDQSAGGDDSGDQETDIGDATGELVDDGPIEFNREYTTALEGDRTEARYTLDAPDGAIMTVDVGNDAASTRGVFVVFESQGQRFADTRVNPGASESELVVLAAEGGAPFELVFTEGPAEFSFEVRLEIQDDAGQGGDAGEDVSGAFEVEAGADVAGLLAGEDRTDHYTVELQPGTELTLTSTVSADSERPADDSFTVDFAASDEGEDTGDAPGELADAPTVSTSSPIGGSVGDRDEGDHYLFVAPSASFSVRASADAAAVRAYLVTIEDASGSRVASFRVQPGAEQTETIEVDPGAQVRLLVTEGRANYSISIG